MHTPHTQLARAIWRKSTHSASSGECVEVAELADGHRALRDSKHRHGPALIVTPASWTAFAAAVKAGRFDH